MNVESLRSILCRYNPEDEVQMFYDGRDVIFGVDRVADGRFHWVDVWKVKA